MRAALLAPLLALALAPSAAIAARVGGSAVFRRFLRDELVPAIRTRYRASEERAIAGESLAGLFVIETFLLEPKLLDHYVALDPSLWWNGRAGHSCPAPAPGESAGGFAASLACVKEPAG